MRSKHRRPRRPTAIAGPAKQPRRGGKGPEGIVSASTPKMSIGPTYSAAAAQAAGQLGGEARKRRWSRRSRDAKTLRELGLLTRDQTATGERVAVMYERYLAAMSFG